MEETNVHLIEECRRGNRTAQLALYKQFAQRLYVACLRIVGNVPEAEEAMQDSFLKIFTRLDQYWTMFRSMDAPYSCSYSH
ncbi:hypothetical protein PN570_15265 [Parabacteroides merdae]|nr:hypothetical protein [Parabacteroides merdae]MDB8934280.1 hypothetical protein [Parabacteroides merdae]MDB8937869.1 hypothetical protein [Parabacteroides merdae]MDB8942187.1 hypothetical protein [Parabacteroides merdae]MDB8945542.1 hypothetical protein [Parabacteroides merdae]MDB8949207.1 hypothetical protein [Parabacteroides merdae]